MITFPIQSLMDEQACYEYSVVHETATGRRQSKERCAPSNASIA
jgi:hypothetical protein